MDNFIMEELCNGILVSKFVIKRINLKKIFCWVEVIRYKKVYIVNKKF